MNSSEFVGIDQTNWSEISNIDIIGESIKFSFLELKLTAGICKNNSKCNGNNCTDNSCHYCSYAKLNQFWSQKLSLRASKL